MFSVIPAFAVYRKELELILANVIPGQYSIQIFHYLRGFSEHARGLSAFGFAGVALSAWFLIDKIFKTINQIFRVRHQRSIAQKAVLYWALLTLGPVVTVGSITVTTYLARLALSGFSGGIVFWGLNTLTFIIQTLGYSAMFYAIPNCRVKWRDAMAGGLFTSVVGLVVKWGFSAYISHGTLTSLYGAFVALPVFMLWIYATWILIFAGAGVTATLPMIASGRFGDTYKHGNSLATGIGLLEALMRGKEAGNPVVPVEKLCRKVDSWPEAVGAILEQLAEVGYVSRVTDRRGKGDAWVLIADPDTATLKPVVAALALDPTIRLFKEENATDSSWYRGLMADKVLNTPLSVVLHGEERQAAAKREAREP